MFQHILDHAASRGYPIHWGSRGFSANVDMDGVHVPICLGYPPACRYGQCLRTSMARAGSITGRVDLPDGQAESVLAGADATGLFLPAGSQCNRRCAWAGGCGVVGCRGAAAGYCGMVTR